MWTRLGQALQTTLTWPIAAGLAAALLIGVGLLIAGWRGRRANDHPICRKCGFDLIGIYGARLARSLTPSQRGDGVAGSTNEAGEPSTGMKCPECGAVISGEGARRRAVRSGVRRRRWIVAAAGLLLAMSAATVLGWFGYREARAYDWNRAKPVWLILREVGAGPQPNSTLMNELMRRAGEKKLTDGHYSRIAAIARARQVDMTQAWDPRWGHLVETGYERGHIDEQEFNRYLNGLIQGTLKVRAKVRAGAPLPAVVKFELRGGSLAWSMFAGSQRELTVAGRDYSNPVRVARLTAPLDMSNVDINRNARTYRYGPKLLGVPFTPRWLADIVDLAGTTGLAVAPEEFYIAAPESPGVYTVKTAWRFRLDTSLGRATDTPRSTAMLAKRVFEPEYSAPFTVVDAAEATAKLDVNEQLAPSMWSCFSARRADPGKLSGEFRTAETPRPYAFDVFARFAGREVYLGSLAPIPDDPLDSTDTRQFLTGEDVPAGAAVSYVLRPSIRAAELSVELETIWGEEIIVEEPVLPAVGMRRSP